MLACLDKFLRFSDEDTLTMSIELPDKETLAKIFAGEEILDIPGGADIVEVIDMAMEALKIAIEEFPLEDYKPIEAYIGNTPYYHFHRNSIQQMNIPSLMLMKDEEGLPFLFLRMFKKDGGWLGEAKCDLMGPAVYFVGETLSILIGFKDTGGAITDEDAREFVIRKSANVLKSALTNLQDRIEITIKSYLQEVFCDWAELWYEYHAESNSLLGFQPKRFSFAKHKETILKQHEEEIRAMWADDSSKELLDLKKKILFLKYKVTLEHWKEMERLQLKGKNWRRYVRADDMSDITDDLIEDFERGANISGIAIEHAARRTGLYNVFDVKEKRLKKRKMGIKDSGYSRSRLFTLKSEGEKLYEENKNSQSTA